MRPPRIVLLALAVAFALGCQDPVHGDRVDMLGGEFGGLRHGPLHRPGQPCTVCHGGEGPANAIFDLAGTVFQHPSGDVFGVPGVSVEVMDQHGGVVALDSNDTGNFYLSEGALGLEFPLRARVRYFDSAGEHLVEMKTPLFRARSCAECHSGPGQRSVPRIFLTEGP